MSMYRNTVFPSRSAEEAEHFTDSLARTKDSGRVLAFLADMVQKPLYMSEIQELRRELGLPAMGIVSPDSPEAQLSDLSEIVQQRPNLPQWVSNRLQKAVTRHCRFPYSPIQALIEHHFVYGVISTDPVLRSLAQLCGVDRNIDEDSQDYPVVIKVSRFVSASSLEDFVSQSYPVWIEPLLGERRHRLDLSTRHRGRRKLARDEYICRLAELEVDRPTIKRLVAEKFEIMSPAEIEAIISHKLSKS